MDGQHLLVADAFQTAFGIVPHEATLRRAINKHGLYAVKIGNKWHTTVAAAKEYTERISAIKPRKSFEPKPKSGRRSVAQFAKDQDKAAKEFADLRISRERKNPR